MEIYKRDRSPYFWYQFSINGQRYRGSTRRTKRTEANRFMMAEYKKLMDIRQHGEKPEITLYDAFQLCVDSVKNKAPSTLPAIS